MLRNPNWSFTLGRMYNDWTLELYAYKTFSNTVKSFEALVMWVGKNSDSSITIRFVMEATGVYHESLAYFLDEKGFHQALCYPIRSAIIVERWTLRQ